MIGNDIEIARKLLVSGQVVAIPTETVYGLAANALDPQTVSQIFIIKNRPTFDPLIVHTYAWEEVKKYVLDIPTQAKELVQAFWPGALTLILPKKKIIPDLVTSGLDTVAFRIPNHPLTLDLLQRLPFPLAAPSANPFGYVSPTKAEHVTQQLGDQLAYILDGGPCEIGLESTIVGFEEGKPIIYRLGGISREAIEERIGLVTVRPHSSSNPKAPGMLKSHYSPYKPLVLLEEGVASLRAKQDIILAKAGVLAFQKKVLGIPDKQQFVLSEKGELTEAARNLFEGLRFLDSLQVETIYAELVPDRGIGRAINDRIRRAAA
ncbi:MAG: L-threonylcarbamoyladenylate synthase [Microscillaceae bacterium]|nr:L-threonylcarbamoyladenylate synthase [Microscillaceae bacterium]